MPTPVTVPGIPYSDAEAAEMQFAQYGNNLYMVHGAHPPAALVYDPAADSWAYTELVIENGPYLDRGDGDEETSLWLESLVDRITLTSTDAAEFTGLVADDLVEYAIEGQYAIGKIVTGGTASVVIEPLPERSLVLSKEVYARGLYTGWNGTDNIPTYNTTITGTGVQVAFSNTQVITQQAIGNYLRFSDSNGTYYWMLVTGVGDILEQGAYGIIAYGDILDVHEATGVLSQSPRTITATLKSSDAAFFDATRDADRLVRLNFNDKIIHARITSGTGDTASVTLSQTIPYTIEGSRRVMDSVTTNWRLGAFYTGNYPRTIAIHEQRLTFGGTPDFNQTVYMSRSANFFDFAETDPDNQVLDDSAITATLASDSMQGIQWMVSDTVLITGTCGGEWQISSGGRDAITPTNITAVRQSSFGSALAQGYGVARSTFYVQRGARKLREMSYDYSVDRFTSLDVTIFAEHILRDHGGAKEIAYAQLPESIVYVLCNDGQICALTYEPDQKVYSWSRLVIGGADAVVTSIETKLEDNEDVLYMLVSRTTAAGTVLSLERLLPTYEPDDSTDFTDMIFLDAYVEVDLELVEVTEAVVTVTLPADYQDMFNEETVSALIDDVPYDNLTVTDAGVITLPIQPASRLIIGFPYTSTFESFPLEGQGRRGTTQAKIKAMDHVSVRVRNAIGFKHGLSDAALTQEPIPSPQAHQNEDIRVPLPNNYSTRATYIIAQSKAYPLTILACFPESALHQ